MAKARTLTLNTKVNVTGADKLRGLGDSLQSTGKKLTVGLTLPIVALGSAMVALASRQEDAERKMTSTFESMGAAAWTTTDAIKAQASALQDMTTFGDEEILEMQAVMLTFGNVTGEAFDKASLAALDMSAALGTDLQGAAIQLGKALNDPIKGVAALSRVGVSFSEDQKEMIRTLQESGDLLGAQTIILGEMERQFGGTAEALAGTTSGQIKQAMNALGDAGEQFGAVIAPMLKDVAQAIKGFAGFLQSLNPETRKFIVITGAMVAALGPLLFIFGSLIKVVVGLTTAYKALFVAQKVGEVSRMTSALGGLRGSLVRLAGPLAIAAAGFAAFELGGQREISDRLGRLKDELEAVGLSSQDMQRAMEASGLSLHEFSNEFLRLIDSGMGARTALATIAGEVQGAARVYTDAQLEMLNSTENAWASMHSMYEQGVAGTAEALRNGAANVTNAATTALQDPVIVAMLGGQERAEEIAGETPGKIAQALLDAQFQVEDAATQLANVAERALHPMIERAQIIGFLGSRELADGLKSNIPAVRAAALELREQAEARLRELNGFQHGLNAGSSFAAGLNAAYGWVRTAAGNLAAATRGQIGIQSEPSDPRSPLRGITKWGANLADTYAEGIRKRLNVIRAAVQAMAAAAVLPNAGLTTPMLAGVPAGAGGTIHVQNITVNVEGRPLDGSVDELVRTIRAATKVTEWGT